jgi:hypothetical protein
MNNPIKIIHKFKNENKRIQYKIYIFIGQLLDKEIESILDKIKNKSFYDTINILSNKNISTLNEFYGENWIYLFFINYHSNSEISKIKKNPAKKKIVQDKMGVDWYNKNIEKIKVKKVQYSFASNYYDSLLARNKIKKISKKTENDFRTYKINTETLVGGGDDLDKLIKDESDDDDDDNKIETIEDLDDEAVDDFDLDELTKLYSMSNIVEDKNVKETSKLISDAINQKSWTKKVETEVKYDDNLDTLPYDTKLEDVFDKEYIKEEYIFMDDNVKTMRDKITVSIPMNPKFKDLKLLPAYQYFWSEYNTVKGKDMIMIGQKWIKKNELLSVDIKPNTNLNVYENLRNNLVYLRDSFGSKIKREDDESKILRDYNEYINNNEIYMIDILNDLGLNFDSVADKKKNLFEVYVNIYFPFLTFEHFNNLINALNFKDNLEKDNNDNQYNIIRNDTKIESEIYTIVEETKLNKEKYSKYFLSNYVIQSIIHVNLLDEDNITGTVSEYKFNLFRIFDNYILDENYPFIQYQTVDGKITYKLSPKLNDNINQLTLAKWFENAPYGLSFKVKINEEKYISININENGRLEYRITWKEIEKADVDNIKDTFKYVKNLIDKINFENKKIKIVIPKDDKFKYAFINTIQQFKLPDNFIINHNNLSDFSRLFFPYISLVIEPKKRLSKLKEETGVSKYGTYLRYKRISDYDNKTKMHLRILYFLKNFELSDRELIDNIAKQFNMTIEETTMQMDIVKKKYGKVLEKSKKIRKKLSGLPKSKPPGVGIDIQGRGKDKYKIRITGARNKYQLQEINDFIKVFIYSYIETYLNKNPKFIKFQKLLEKLNKIARRRNKVKDIVDYEFTIKEVKAIISLDKKRLGFRPEEGQNQWTRSCQNSGNDKKRRPTVIAENNIVELRKMGYKFNDKTKFYEKEIERKEKGNVKKVIIRAIKLSGDNNTNNYYICNPDTNKEHIYIGFLSKGNNPSELCMPCCFKKDQYNSDNKQKKNYFKKCLGDKTADENIEMLATKNLTDKLYILQDTNKIQEGRFIFLPKYLNLIFNKLWNHDYIIKNHYLTKSNSGFFFKFTVKDAKYYYLAAIANILDMKIGDIIKKGINFMEKDKDDKYFNYLENGNTRTAFKRRVDYINFLNSNKNLDFSVISELISLPKVIDDDGLFHIILQKKTFSSGKYTYFIQCLNTENFDIYKNKKIIILINEGKHYFPIYRVQKRDTDKKISLQKIFKFDDDNVKKIIDEILKYYNQSCIDNLLNTIEYNSKLTNKKLISQIENIKGYKIKHQIIDTRFKVKYIELNSKLLLPTQLSGSNYNYPLFSLLDINKENLLDLKKTIDELKNINKDLKLDYIPFNVNFDKNIKSKIRIISITLKNKLVVPIKPQIIEPYKIKKLKLSYSFRSLEEKIDNSIMKKEIPKSNSQLNYVNYYNEGYNLFRLEFSNFLMKNFKYKEDFVSLTTNENISDKDKKKEIYNLIIKIVNNKLASKLPKIKDFVKIVKKLVNLDDYEIKNVRNTCDINKNEKSCKQDHNCIYDKNVCKFSLYEEFYIDYISKMIEEILENGIKFNELIQKDDYFVSDIVKYDTYTNRLDQEIITSNNYNIKKLMNEIFGSDTQPIIGKRRLKKDDVIMDDEEYKMLDFGDRFIQEVYNNNNTVIRAYANCYYWINNKLYDKHSRNLGHFSDLQTKLANMIKINIIDFIQKNRKNKDFKDELDRFNDVDKGINLFDSNLSKFKSNLFNTEGYLELFCLSFIYPYPIVVYNNYNNVIYIMLNGNIKINTNTIEKFTNKNNLNSTIFIKFYFEKNNNIPYKVESIYYL